MSATVRSLTVEPEVLGPRSLWAPVLDRSCSSDRSDRCCARLDGVTDTAARSRVSAWYYALRTTNPPDARSTR